MVNTKVSKEIVILPADTNEMLGSPTAAPGTPSRLSNRVKKPVQILTSNRKGELTDKTLELATAKDFAQAPLVDRVQHSNKQLSNPGREAATFFLFLLVLHTQQLRMRLCGLPSLVNLLRS
jgi:hypothetical protein